MWGEYDGQDLLEFSGDLIFFFFFVASRDSIRACVKHILCPRVELKFIVSVFYPSFDWKFD